MKNLFMILFSLFLFAIFHTTGIAQPQPIATIGTGLGFEKSYNTANGKFIVVSNFGVCAKHVLTEKELNIVYKQRQEMVQKNEEKYNVKIAMGVLMRCDMIRFPGGDWITTHHFLIGFFDINKLSKPVTVIHFFNNKNQPVFIAYINGKKINGQWVNTLIPYPPLPPESCLITKPVRKNYYRVNSPCGESRHAGYVYANPKTGWLDYVKTLPK